MPNNANTNIVHIVAVEGLAEEISGHITEIKVKGAEQQKCKVFALRALAYFQVDELHKLRQIFEE